MLEVQAEGPLGMPPWSDFLFSPIVVGREKAAKIFLGISETDTEALSLEDDGLGCCCLHVQCHLAQQPLRELTQPVGLLWLCKLGSQGCDSTPCQATLGSRGRPSL